MRNIFVLIHSFIHIFIHLYLHIKHHIHLNLHHAFFLKNWTHNNLQAKVSGCANTTTDFKFLNKIAFIIKMKFLSSYLSSK